MGKINLKQNLAKIVFGIILLLAISFCIYVAVTHDAEPPSINRSSARMDEGWYTLDEKGQSVDIEIPRKKGSKSEEHFTIYNQIPMDVKDGEILLQWVTYSDATVLINGSVRTVYDDSQYRLFGKNSMSGYLEIPLYGEDAGATIQINYYSAYDMTRGRVESFAYGDAMDVKMEAVIGRAPILLTALFILLIGIIVTVGGLVVDIVMKDSIDTSITFLGVAMILYSMDPIYVSKYVSFFWGDTFVWYLIFRTCSFMVAIPLLFFFDSWQQRHFHKWLMSAAWLNIAFCILSAILQLTNVHDLVELQIVKNLCIAVSFLTIVITCIMEGIHGNTKKMKGMLIPTFAMCISFAIVIFQNFVVRELNTYTLMYPGALLTFILIVFVTAKNLFEETQRAVWQNKAKTEFLAMMSHDIRTPINAVLGMDEMILRESKEENISEYALNIKNAGQVLLSLISDVLDLSKIESGKMEIVESPYQVEPFLDHLVNIISPQMKSKELEFEVQIDPNIPVELSGDEISLTHIVSNLLTNALKYTHHGGVTLKMELQKQDSDGVDITYSIQDTGVGIKPEDLSKIFDMFKRVDEKKNAHIEGSGLGLSIASHFLGMMKSRLEVESTYGEGTRFFFTIHQPVVDAKKLGTYAKKERRNGTAVTAYVRSFKAPGAHIMVVDDSKVNLLVFKGLLNESEIKVDTASSGAECLQLIESNQYDVIFMDHLMPEMDGIETLKELKKENSPCRNTPVIILTANAVSGSREMYMEYGFSDYLSKPILLDRLDAMLLRYLPEEYIIKI